MIDYTFTKATTIPQAFEKLYQILTILRSEDGCPWDREQTPSQVSQAILDETYEYIDALWEKQPHLCEEEIGDVLLNVCMALRIHEEYREFSPIDAINSVCEKLVRRHPHVFSDVIVHKTEEVLDVWNTIKVELEGKSDNAHEVFERIPKSLPKLDEAYEMQKKMKKLGFDWPSVDGVLEKIQEEQQELTEALQSPKNDMDHIEEELGDLLFAVVNLARFIGVHPSKALHRSNQKIKKRFTQLVRRCTEEQIPLTFDNADTLNKIWEEIKQQ